MGDRNERRPRLSARRVERQDLRAKLHRVVAAGADVVVAAEVEAVVVGEKLGEKLGAVTRPRRLTLLSCLNDRGMHPVGHLMGGCDRDVIESCGA